MEDNDNRAVVVAPEETRRQEGTPAGYLDQNGSPQAWSGDETTPYVGIVGRGTFTPTAADPGVPPIVQTGDPQRVLTDEYGRIVTVVANAPSGDLPLDISLIPQIANAGVLIVSAVPAELFEAWVGDFQSVTQRFLLVFDAAIAPIAGAIPALAAIPLIDFTDYDFSTEAGPRAFTVGIVLALSTTPNSYTAIVPANDFAISARYKVT